MGWPEIIVALMSWFPWVGFFLIPGERSHFVPLFDKNTGERFFHLTDGFRYYSAAGDLVHLGEMSLVSHFPGFFGGILAAWCVLNKQTKAKTNGCSESVIHWWLDCRIWNGWTWEASTVSVIAVLGTWFLNVRQDHKPHVQTHVLRHAHVDCIVGRAVSRQSVWWHVGRAVSRQTDDGDVRAVCAWWVWTRLQYCIAVYTDKLSSLRCREGRL